MALVLLATIRIAATYTVFNHTFDEPAHIACGMEWLDSRAYTWEAQHPPLARVAAALGPYLLGIRAQHTPHTDETSKYWEGDAILQAGGQYDRNLSAARAGMLPFFWIACLVVYVWGERSFGKAVAVVAVFLFSFVPTVLAHAGLATTDMALTAFLGAAFLTGWMWLEDPTPARALLFGAMTALALLAKFSALVFFPVAVAVAAALAWYFATERPRMGSVVSEVLRRLPTFSLAVAAGAVIVWGAYWFSWGKVDFTSVRLPAPDLFKGIEQVVQHNNEGHPAYFMGERGRKGFLLFFPVALAVKTPMAFLLLAAFGVYLAFRRDLRSAGVPLAYAAGILGVSMFSNINIGLRHILPVFTGLSLVAAFAALWIWKAFATRMAAKAALGVLFLWMAATSLASHPDYIPYFNFLAGSHPENILVDSDLDWGQDMKRAAKRLHELGAPGVAFVRAMMLAASLEEEVGFPRIYPTQIDRPLPGWNLTTWTTWKGRYFGYETPPPITPWPERFPPTEKVGSSVLLWYFPPQPGIQSRP